MTDERLETLCLNLASVLASGFTAYTFGTWAQTGSVDVVLVVASVLIWVVLATGWRSWAGDGTT